MKRIESIYAAGFGVLFLVTWGVYASLAAILEVTAGYEAISGAFLGIAGLLLLVAVVAKIAQTQLQPTGRTIVAGFGFLAAWLIWVVVVSIFEFSTWYVTVSIVLLSAAGVLFVIGGIAKAVQIGVNSSSR